MLKIKISNHFVKYYNFLKSFSKFGRLFPNNFQDLQFNFTIIFFSKNEIHHK